MFLTDHTGIAVRLYLKLPQKRSFALNCNLVGLEVNHSQHSQINVLQLLNYLRLLVTVSVCFNRAAPVSLEALHFLIRLSKNRLRWTLRLVLNLLFGSIRYRGVV